jgi:S-disulfanyl-L-cysteine oxidoreductase SoxD
MKTVVLAALMLAAQMKTTGDSVYTAAQATRGETVYSASCASCHAPNLSGKGQASSLAGSDFNDAWNGQSLADLFERIQTTMPADAPGTLKPPETADVMAFILSKAAFPAGETELPADAAALKEITFVAPRRDLQPAVALFEDPGM